jgi:MFS family permease
MIAIGWTIYACTYLGFAFASRAWHVWALFAIYGIYYALVEGPERALVADLAAPGHRGRAYGWFYATTGLLTLPASAIFGGLYAARGALLPFTVAAALAFVAGALVLLAVPEPRRAPRT